MKKLFTILAIALMAISAKASTLEVCGHNLSSYYASQINQMLTDDGYLKSGTVTYDYNNNKLTLNNANILCDQTIINTFDVEDLEIEVIGNCTLRTKIDGNENMDNQLSCIFVKDSENPMTINFTGSGSLKMRSTNIAFLAFNRYSLLYKFNGPDVTINAARGIWSSGVYRVAYQMNAGSLKIWTQYGAIDHAFNMDDGVYGTMTFGSGMKILEPYDGQWSCKLPMGNHCGIKDMNGSVNNVKIGSKYDLWLGDIQVTTQNCDNILGDGKAVYTQSDNTLILNNVTISNVYQVITSDIVKLHIKLLGENHLVSQHNVYSLYLTECDGVLIDGGGSLLIESAVDQACIGFFTHRIDAPAHLTIRDCSISLPAGMIQNEDNDCSLTLDNAYIYIRDGYFCTPPVLTLNNCHITKPEGGHVNEYGQVCGPGDNGMYWGEIEIVPDASAVVGDVDGDGNVTSADVMALYNFLLDNDDSALVNGDQDGDGFITSGDVTIVYNILLGN
ncbi:MAG: dockerin type I repeat-containing protein [Muribaculaceae bacterium]|nr:dockerin type I repeat-containing protein [Muribaculaceae bacterium]